MLSHTVSQESAMIIRKVTVEDYIQLPTGIRTEQGETVMCPVCKRVSVVKKIGGKTIYFHQLVYEFHPKDEHPKEVRDFCSS